MEPKHVGIQFLVIKCGVILVWRDEPRYEGNELFLVNKAGCGDHRAHTNVREWSWYERIDLK